MYFALLSDLFLLISKHFDQLFEICQKYCLTHDILIGGDNNEDISRNKSDNRAKYIQQLIQDCHLQVCSAGNTYVNPTSTSS
jgi:hypothetical protein